jgi:hypothetical protein
MLTVVVEFLLTGLALLAVEQTNLVLVVQLLLVQSSQLLVYLGGVEGRGG